MVWKANEDWSGRELEKVWPFLVPYTMTDTLDIGAGRRRVFDHWTTVDGGKDYGGKRVADLHHDLEKPLRFMDESWSSVVSSHCLEHMTDWKRALRDWWRYVKVGGHLCLYLPDMDAYPRCGQPGANPDHKVDLHPDMVIEAMMEVAEMVGGGFDLLENERRHGGSEYSFLLVFRKRVDREFGYTPWQRTPKSALVIRYGGIGDGIMATSVVRALADEGWAVTVNADTTTEAVFRGDPAVSHIIVQGKGQVPDDALLEYWQALGTRYDKVVNLCEAVEGALLTLPDRANDRWSDEMRRQELGTVNYVQRMHEIAGVEHNPRPGVALDETEVNVWRRRFAKDLPPGRPIIGWVLNGSGPQKVWPWAAEAIVRLLYHSNPVIVFLGGQDSVELQELVVDQIQRFAGDQIRGEPISMVKACGTLKVRESIAIATLCTAVVGPETGLLNAVSHCADVGKVVMLSHSSPTNLTRDWPNTVALGPDPAKVPCFPCHRMHLDWSRCNRHSTGAAACAAGITIDPLVDAVISLIGDR